MAKTTIAQNTNDKSSASTNFSDRTTSSGRALIKTPNSTGSRRTGLTKNLHSDTSEDLIDHKITKATQTTGEVIKQSFGATNNIFMSLFDKAKSFFSGIDSESSDSSKVAKKTIVGVLSGGFLIAGLKSTIDFLKHLFNRDSKKNGILKLFDASIKWFMGFGLFRTFTNKKGFKFQNLPQILLGSGAALCVSQLSGINDGKRNVLRALSKVTGVENTLEEVSGYTPLPDGERIRSVSAKL